MANRWFRVVAVVVIFFCGLVFFGPKTGLDAGQYIDRHTPGHVSQPQSAPLTGGAKCTVSSSKSKPLMQYVLMVDAGSQGSRIHVYRFNNCNETPELEDEQFLQLKPGLSSFKDDAEGAAKSLDPLLELALEHVPENLRSCTPIAVKATAGLRMLGDERSEKILAAVRTRLETKYPFAVLAKGDDPKKDNGVHIMDGADEGVYAWITTNYLLGKIGNAEKVPTAAVFDLGGGSTQIVFEPTYPSIGGGMPEKLADGDHKYLLNFGGRDFQLYQHSHLHLGLMAAQERIHKEIIAGKKALTAEKWNDTPTVNPCIVSGMEYTFKYEEDDSTVTEVKMVGPRDPSAPQCRALAEKILNKGADCALTPCSFGGIHQPPLERTFAREDIFIFSFFYDRLQPLGMPESFTLREVMDTTAKVCAGKDHWAVFAGFPDALKELEENPQYCLDLSFMLALLHTGYEMPIDREVKTAKQIKGSELGWCLGASLPLLDTGKGDWTCRIKEIH